MMPTKREWSIARDAIKFSGATEKAMTEYFAQALSDYKREISKHFKKHGDELVLGNTYDPGTAIAKAIETYGEESNADQA